MPLHISEKQKRMRENGWMTVIGASLVALGVTYVFNSELIDSFVTKYALPATITLGTIAGLFIAYEGLGQMKEEEEYDN
jgi:hypothetical protein